MASLKHLLNDNDESEASTTPSLTFQSSFQDSPFEFSQSDSFTFPEGDWSGLYSELFASDSIDGNCFDLPFDDGFLCAEEDLSSWAAGNVSECDLAVVSSDQCDEQGQLPNTNNETVVNETVCYGMIYRAMVKLEGDMSHLHRLVSAKSVRHDSGMAVLPIRRARALTMTLEFPDGTRFADINRHHAAVFNTIFETHSIELEAFVDLIVFKQTIESALKAREATMRVNVNVYGSNEHLPTIGKLLSDEKIFLQDPDHPRPGLRTINPHVLEVSVADCNLLPAGPRTEHTRTEGRNAEDELLETVSELYKSLKRGNNLKQIIGDARLQTPLLQHQQEALDFMTQRETGPTPEEFCLWKEVHEDGQVCYRHAITNALSPTRRPETGGGVLADTMGLGKTLSILALIAKTQVEACCWEKGTEAKPDGMPSRNPSRATLVIVPSFLLLNHWSAEIRDHLDGSLLVRNHHGQGRERNPSKIADSDIVLTTYFTLAEEVRSAKSPLCEIEWFRIVLDEAHIIRRRGTALYQTVAKLSGQHRWCLTGTPIQNRLDDLGSLFCFIGVSPFDRMPVFRKYITLPFEEKFDQRALAIRNMRLLFDSLCLRRNRDVVENLPWQEETIRFLDFSQPERKQYEITKQAMFRAIRDRVGMYDRTNDFGMFQAQMHLRLLCNHGTFQNPFSWTNQRNMTMEREVALEFFGQTGEVSCSSCMQSLPLMSCDTLYESWGGLCRHLVCNDCMAHRRQFDREEDSGDQPGCPLCLESGVKPSQGSLTGNPHRKQDDFLLTTGFSTKLNALAKDVENDLWRSKSLIFSFWTRTLDLIDLHLQRLGIPFHRIDGSTPLHQRQKILDDFSSNPASPVLMMTTGTGAFGLNLPAANRVFIVEPLFNPATERQAIARAVRLGQKHKITVMRYVINQTVEEDMRSQQEKKLKLAEVGWKD